MRCRSRVLLPPALCWLVLTPTLLRLEYSPDGSFADRPTLNAANRDFDPPPFRARRVDGQLVITTSRMRDTYDLGSGRFGPDNLAVELEVAGRRKVRRPEFPAATEYQSPPSLRPTATPAYVDHDPSYRLPAEATSEGGTAPWTARRGPAP
jgi:hypothetical protein